MRLNSVMAPEFIESQYENPAYPIERCIIYDAGSRAFWLPEYCHDVIDYWKQNLSFAEQGMTYAQLLAERFPSLDVSRFSGADLKTIARTQIQKMEKMIKG